MRASTCFTVKGLHVAVQFITGRFHDLQVLTLDSSSGVLDLL